MKKVQYPDTWLRIAGIPILALFIRHFGADEPLYELFHTTQYYLDLVWNALFILLIWEINKYIIITLDKRYSWANYLIERLVIQSALVLGFSFLAAIGLIYLHKELLVQHPGFTSKNNLNVPGLPYTFLFVMLVNFLYTSIYLVYYHHFIVNKLTQERDEAFQVAEQLRLDLFYNENNEIKHGAYQENLIVNLGHASIPVLINDIAYVFSKADNCFIKTFDGREYTSRSSLENLETLVNPEIFFRINRQMLAHARSVKKIKQDKYGELEIEFTPPFQNAVFVSKKKALQFKQWLGKEI